MAKQEKSRFKELKRKKCPQEERRYAEGREEEKKQREELISKIEIILNKRTEIIAQLLENLLREHSDQSGDNNAYYGNADIDNSETSS